MSHWSQHLDPTASSGRYLRWKEVERSTGLSRTTAWRLQRAGEFPRPYVISPGRVGYREDEIAAWRDSRGHRSAPSDEGTGGGSTVVLNAERTAVARPGPDRAPRGSPGPSVARMAREPPEKGKRRRAAPQDQIQFDF